MPASKVASHLVGEVALVGGEDRGRDLDQAGVSAACAPGVAGDAYGGARCSMPRRPGHDQVRGQADEQAVLDDPGPPVQRRAASASGSSSGAKAQSSR